MSEHLRQKVLLNTIDIIEELSECRVDIKNWGGKNNRVVVTSNNKVSFDMPEWFQRGGEGIIIKGNAINKPLSLKIKCVNAGLLRLVFRGGRIDSNNQELPIWVDFQSIRINNNEILPCPLSLSHTSNYTYSMSVLNDQEIFIEIKSKFHVYTEDELRLITSRLHTNSDISIDFKDINNWYSFITGSLFQISSDRLDNIAECPSVVADCFVPIGSMCRCAHWLRKFNLRYCSLPFDWLVTNQLEIISSALKNGVDCWFENFIEENKKNGKKNRYVVDKKYNIISKHDFSIDYTVIEKYPEVIDVFKRRYTRLVKILSNSNHVCFISSRTEHLFYFVNFLKNVREIYPNCKFTLLNVFHDPEARFIQRYHLDSGDTIINIYGNDINENGSNKKINSHFWVGNENLWKSVMNKCSLSKESNEIYKLIF